MAFREDGSAAMEWVARYLERVDEFPVLAQVEPGEIRAALPAEPPERARAVLGRPARPRRGADARRSRTGRARASSPTSRTRERAGDPRRAARRRAEPGRDPLAHLARAPGAGGAHARLAAAAARASRRLRGPHRGHGVERDADRARRRTARAAAAGAPSSRPSTRTRRWPRRRGCSSWSSAPFRWTTPSRSAPDALDLDGACAVVATVGTTSTAVGRSRPGDRGRVRARRRLAPRRRRVRRPGGDLPGASPPLRGLGARRLGRRQPAQVAAHADGLLGAVDATARRLPRRAQPRAGVPARRRGGRQPQRGRPPARPPLPGAQALGGAALPRPRGHPGDDPRARPPRRALRVVGARRAGLGGERAAALLARLLPARRRATTRTRRCSRASTRAARPSSRTRGSATATCCASRSATRGRPRTTCAARGTCCAARHGRAERYSASCQRRLCG